MNQERARAYPLSYSWYHWLYTMLCISIICGGLYGGYLAYTSIRSFAAHTQFAPILFSTIPMIVEQQPKAASFVPAPSAEKQPIQAPIRSEIYPDIENKERINILFMGIDQRPGEPTTCRTDTMILVSINPKDMSASLLSIPRDLWVRIPHPKHPEGKINTAHRWGEVENYPGGGPALAMRTIHNTFGVRMHYYVRLNFTGFEQIIDTIGGIDLDVPSTIDDPKYPNGSYGFEHLYIEAGAHHFDGEMSLKYARTRNTKGNDDFTRMARQQQVIMSIRDRVLQLENLPQLITQMPQLARDMGNSLETNITTDLDVMLTLAQWAQQIETENIHFASIDRRMTTDKVIDGQEVLIYDRNKARPIIESLFGSATPQVQASETSQVQRLETEQARVAVYNGTNIYGLAGRVSDFLKKQGINVVLIENADRFDYEQTIVTTYQDKPFTVSWLTEQFGIQEQKNQPKDQDDIDIAIIIGQDFPAENFEFTP